MTIKIPKNPSTKDCTEFQVHKSHRGDVFGKHVIDYSEHRLRRHIQKVDDAQQKAIIENLIIDYVEGRVAIAWKKGKPIWIKLTKA